MTSPASKGVAPEQIVKFEASMMLARRVSQARFDEQKRIGDRIEIMLYESKSAEVSEALVSLAHYIFDGGKR